MELEQLRIFTAVAQTGSFTKGAKLLYISHSTTSRAVAALEEELGVRLFERDNHISSLTPAGKMLLEEAKNIIASVDALGEKLSSAGADAER
ncbi:MAG: LysR family transcriptional regulator [Oscillospiraceae bacterium]|nr:LysR family transcriptional regulator [Oscillospiraceae bacterium]